MTTKHVSISEFLTEEQALLARRLYIQSADNIDAVAQIHAQVIKPNIDEINAKLGQENDPRYLAYAVVHVINKLADQLLDEEKLS